eukprot:79419-Amphidinium_carterae.1
MHAGEPELVSPRLNRDSCVQCAPLGATLTPYIASSPCLALHCHDWFPPQGLSLAKSFSGHK